MSAYKGVRLEVNHLNATGRIDIEELEQRRFATTGSLGVASKMDSFELTLLILALTSISVPMVQLMVNEVSVGRTSTRFATSEMRR